MSQAPVQSGTRSNARIGKCRYRDEAPPGVGRSGSEGRTSSGSARTPLPAVAQQVTGCLSRHCPDCGRRGGTGPLAPWGNAGVTRTGLPGAPSPVPRPGAAAVAVTGGAWPCIEKGVLWHCRALVGLVNCRDPDVASRAASLINLVCSCREAYVVRCIPPVRCTVCSQQ